MRSLKVLHLASFSGNIGDNANHMGFRPWLERLAGRPIEWSQLEIREFYWRERQWDEHFVELANAHDAVVIGGGNYFELWVEQSPTGTSIGISPELFRKIRVPVFFNALGVDPGQGVPETSRQRFSAFLDELLGSEQYLVSVRNDGARANLRQHIGEHYAAAVHHAPDNGFFADFEALSDSQWLTPDRGRPRVAINIASDMADVRFSEFALSGGQAGFAREMAQAIVEIADVFPVAEFVLIPHIFRDLEIQSEIISYLPDRLRRTRLMLGPYGSGDGAARYSFGLYAKADVALGMRFHANVCSLGLRRQTLGLCSYPQISALYEELGQMDRVVDVSRPGFVKELGSKVVDALTAPEKFSAGPEEALRRATGLREALEPHVSRWLDQI